MIDASALGMAQNAALLITLVVLFNGFTHALRRAGGSIMDSPGLLIQALSGLLIGFAGIAIMATPWVFVPGVVFDTRSVLLVISGLFFGFVPTSIAMLLTAGYRVYLGGGGILTGTLVILAMGSLGITWRHLRRPALEKIAGLELFLLGLLAHVVMLGLMFTLPRDTALPGLSQK